MRGEANGGVHFLQDGLEDTWDWNLDPGKGYTVQGAYELLSYAMQIDKTVFYNIVCPCDCCY